MFARIKLSIEDLVQEKFMAEINNLVSMPIAASPAVVPQ